MMPLKCAKADTSVGCVICSAEHIKIHAGRKQRGNLQPVRLCVEQAHGADREDLAVSLGNAESSFLPMGSWKH